MLSCDQIIEQLYTPFKMANKSASKGEFQYTIYYKQYVELVFKMKSDTDRLYQRMILRYPYHEQRMSEIKMVNRWLIPHTYQEVEDCVHEIDRL